MNKKPTLTELYEVYHNLRESVDASNTQLQQVRFLIMEEKKELEKTKVKEKKEAK